MRGNRVNTNDNRPTFVEGQKSDSRFASPLSNGNGPSNR